MSEDDVVPAYFSGGEVGPYLTGGEIPPAYLSVRGLKYTEGNLEGQPIGLTLVGQQIYHRGVESAYAEVIDLIDQGLKRKALRNLLVNLLAKDFRDA